MASEIIAAPLGTRVETIILPIELTNHNDGRGHHWQRTASERKRIFKKLLTLGFKRQEPYAFPTHNLVTRILGPRQRLWDSSSLGRGNWKEIEDSLVELGWWKDDGPDWITNTDFRQTKEERDLGPAIRLEVFRSA
jgi:hypothetical protein